MLCILNLSLKEITLQNELHNCMTIKVFRTQDKCSCQSWESNLWHRSQMRFLKTIETSEDIDCSQASKQFQRNASKKKIAGSTF